MSRFYVNKFLYHTDRDPDLLAAYKADPQATLESWEREAGPWMDKSVHVEKISWHGFTEDERDALVRQDYTALFALGAHYFVTLQVFMGMFDVDYELRSGPLSFQKEYAKNMSHWLGREYPSVEL
jgi:hypothetical protein